MLSHRNPSVHSFQVYEIAEFLNWICLQIAQLWRARQNDVCLLCAHRLLPHRF